MVINGDPVAEGFVDSLSRPGGNITGLTRLTRELSGKRLKLLKEAVPGLLRVGVLWDTDNPEAGIGFKEYDAAALGLKVRLQSLEVRGPNPDLVALSKSPISPIVGRLESLFLDGAVDR
jgi:putative ABC transport system substrate-binding protein